jgi:hypothetical protein
MKTKTKFKLSTVWCHKSFRLTASLLHSSSSLSFSDCNCQRPYGTSPSIQLSKSVYKNNSKTEPFYITLDFIKKKLFCTINMLWKVTRLHNSITYPSR